MALQTIHATIAPGDSESGPIECNGGSIVLMTMPPEWTPALLSFLVSTDGIEYFPLHDYTGDQLAINVEPGAAVLVPEDWSRAIGFLKLLSSSPQNDMRVFKVSILSRAETEPPPEK